MVDTLTSNIFQILSPAFSLLCVILWGIFFSIFSPKAAITLRLLFFSFLLGVASMLSAFLIEELLINNISIDYNSISNLFNSYKYLEFLAPLLYTVIIAAIVEELIKFFIMRKLLDSPNADKVIFGIKIGLWVGLGFAFIENIFYFIRFLDNINSISSLALAFIARGAFSTLAHGMYGVIMGYYLSLAKFHRLYQPFFFKNALITCIVAHGLFNFLLVTYYGYLSIIFIVIILFIVLRWYDDRRNIEVELPEKILANGQSPFLAHKYEVETILTSQNMPMSFFQKILSWFT